MTDRNLRGPSERANRRLLMLSGLLGGVIGLGVALAALSQRSPGGAHVSPLSGPLPAWVALLVALAWGALLPLISWRWHRVVDEHERDAYRDGAVAGYYVVAIGAPVWWFLWRGGWAPAVDPVWLYLSMMLASGTIWMWRKYR